VKKVKKPVFFLVAGFIIVFAVLTTTGVHTRYGDITTTWIRGVRDIRWGIDIRGGVDVTFAAPEGQTVTKENVDAAKAIIETRLVTKHITDYEIYPDYNKAKIIVRFPWQADNKDFNPESAVKELGETAMLTFREGAPVSASANDLPLVMSGEDIESAEPRYNSQATADDKYIVQLKMKPSGQKKFSAATEKLVGKQISIWLDDTCISAPNVHEKIESDTCEISGRFDADSATALANKINGGALPYKLITENFSTISPSLGEGAKDAMALAGIISFSAISVFMLLMYRLPGVIAVLGLLGQVFGSLAVVSGFFAFNDSFTLTIPGIAGIILSIGMGVDANVITGERIKEELRAGKTLDNALQSGYKRAFSAIFDGNVTLILIAFVLMGAFGTPDSFASKVLSPVFFMFGPSTAGAIYSFGFTLIVGAALNFVFGVFAARLMTYSISKFKALRKKHYYGGFKEVVNA
jgi:protein-export membrane protein SecD